MSGTGVGPGEAMPGKRSVNQVDKQDHKRIRHLTKNNFNRLFGRLGSASATIRQSSRQERLQPAVRKVRFGKCDHQTVSFQKATSTGCSEG